MEQDERVTQRRPQCECNTRNQRAR